MNDEIKEILIKDFNEILVKEFCTDWKEKRLYIELLVNSTPFSNLLDYITNLQEKLKVSQTNEETYRLEMKDITKRLGFDEDTLFDEVKDKAERLNNIINEYENWLKTHLDEEFYWFKMYDKLQELKGDSSNE